MTITRSMNRTGRLAIAAAIVGIAACGKATDQSTDPALKADLAAASAGMANDGLQLAPAGNKAQVVVSAIEGGPQSAPQHASVKRIPHPTPKPAPRMASARTPVPAPAPVENAPVEAPAPQPVQQAPVAAPTPAPTSRQPGVYKSEGEIFRQMPWIKP